MKPGPDGLTANREPFLDNFLRKAGTSSKPHRCDARTPQPFGGFDHLPPRAFGKELVARNQNADLRHTSCSSGCAGPEAIRGPIHGWSSIDAGWRTGDQDGLPASRIRPRLRP